MKNNESPRTRAMDDALRLLSYRSRSRKELTDSLKRKKHSAETIAEVMAYLEQSGYINDPSFARGWTHYRRSTSSVGALKVKHELLRRGVDAELAAETVASLCSETDERERAFALAEKKWRTLKNKDHGSPHIVYGRIGRFLAGKGFSGEIIRAVLDDLLGNLET